MTAPGGNSLPLLAASDRTERCNNQAPAGDSDYVSMRQHPSFQGRTRRTATVAAEPEVTAEPATEYELVPRYCDRACCCLAPPTVIAVLPPADGRPTVTELLLCGHHYRAAIAALAAAEATVLDLAGHKLAPGAWQ